MLHIIVKTVLFALCLVLGAFDPLLVLQQVSYRIKEFFSVLVKKTVLPVTAGFFVVSVVLCFFEWYFLCVCAVAYCLFCLSSLLKKKKKPLALTKRVVRLLVVYGVFAVMLSILQTFVKYCFPLAFCSVLALAAANVICRPVEKVIARSFIDKAKRKLNDIRPVVIAITGSYGKTSLKNILAEILKTSYNVYASPKSYNTPLGLAKCINEELEDGCEIFIAEAGARYKGDIAEICSFIKPDIAVITAVGNQHMSTFKTQENLRNEKFSIVCESVKEVFVNGDEVKDIPRLNTSKRITVCGKDGNLYYKEVVRGKTEQSFVVCGENVYSLSCSLLADYAPSMITLAVSVAEYLGVSQKNIKNSIKRLKPIAHRLEILYNDKDVIIDDAYNSNERGFISAVDLLGLYDDKIKVIITPGVVELGKEQSAINYRLAQYASERADYIFTYGVNAVAIKQGAGFKCEAFKTLDECMTRYKSIRGERAVLFENDLPDVY